MIYIRTLTPVILLIISFLSTFEVKVDLLFADLSMSYISLFLKPDAYGSETLTSRAAVTFGVTAVVSLLVLLYIYFFVKK